jgi:hypothetical protein
MTEIVIFRPRPEFRYYDSQTESWDILDVSLKNTELNCLIPVTPDVFDIDPEQWVKENNKPLVFLGATVFSSRRVFCYHPTYGSQEGYIDMIDYGERRYYNLPEWIRKWPSSRELLDF